MQGLSPIKDKVRKLCWTGQKGEGRAVGEENGERKLLEKTERRGRAIVERRIVKEEILMGGRTVRED